MSKLLFFVLMVTSVASYSEVSSESSKTLPTDRCPTAYISSVGSPSGAC